MNQCAPFGFGRNRPIQSRVGGQRASDTGDVGRLWTHLNALPKTDKIRLAAGGQKGSVSEVVTTRVACAQLNLPVGDVEGCLDKTCSAIIDARSKGAELIVLPELASCGYPLASADEARSCAEKGSLSLQRWQEAASGGMTVVAGFCESASDGVYNSCVLIDQSGVRAIYRKGHLWDREKLLFSPGAAAPLLFDTSFGVIAMAICYDLEFPELTRNLALAGADF